MKNIGYLSYTLIASFALGVCSYQARSERMSEQEIAERVPDFQYGWSIYKVLNSDPIILKTKNSFEKMQLCFASVVPAYSPSSFTYDQKEKYTIWSLDGYRLVVRYLKIDEISNVEIYGIELNKRNSLKKYINRISICTGNSSIESDE